MNLKNYSNLSPERIEELQQATARHAGMLEALNWAIAQSPHISPMHIVANVVVQDEYTHDVILRAGDDAYLVYGTS